MPKKGDKYIVEIKPSHIDWGKYRNPTNRDPVDGESYVKIPAEYAKKYDIKRGDTFTAHFTNGTPDIQIKASGNGPLENGIQYAKQFEGIGDGACKAFTPWYQECDVKEGDKIKVEFLSPDTIEFKKNKIIKTMPCFINRHRFYIIGVNKFLMKSCGYNYIVFSYYAFTLRFILCIYA